MPTRRSQVRTLYPAPVYAVVVLWVEHRIVYPIQAGSIPVHGAIFRIDSANHLAKLFGCLATKAILFFVGALCNGSTTDFDSVSSGSIPLASANNMRL